MMLACPLMRSARLFNGLREQRVLVPYLSSRKSFEDAQELITRFGDDAGFQAAALADRSRDVGNHIHFCHWRQIERLIIRSEEHTSELQSLMRISYAVFCLKKKTDHNKKPLNNTP